MANPNDNDGSPEFRIRHLEDLVDDVRTAAHLALARVSSMVDIGQGASHDQLVDLAKLLSDELDKLSGG